MVDLLSYIEHLDETKKLTNSIPKQPYAIMIIERNFWTHNDAERGGESISYFKIKIKKSFQQTCKVIVEEIK